MGGGGGEGFVEDSEHEIDIGFGDAHWRFDPEDISKETALADEETAFPALFEDFGNGFAIGFFGFTVFHRFDPDHKAHATNITDRLVFFLEFAKSIEETFAKGGTPLLKIVPPHDLESGPTLGHGNGISSVGIEMDSLGKSFGDFVGSDDGGKGCAVADAFGHDDNVGLNALVLKTPEGFACAAEASLDFIGDAETIRQVCPLLPLLPSPELL